MKKYVSLMISAVALCFTMFMGDKIAAYSSNSQMAYITGKSINETRFSDGIIKKETISCHKYDYGKEIPNDTYQYLVARVEVVYSDESDKCLASAYLETTFRYNKKFNLSKCLSTSHGASVSSDKYSLEAFGRTKNLSLSVGESFGKISFSCALLENDVNKYIFSCDNNGNVVRFIV